MIVSGHSSSAEWRLGREGRARRPPSAHGVLLSGSARSTGNDNGPPAHASPCVWIRALDPCTQVTLVDVVYGGEYGSRCGCSGLISHYLYLFFSTSNTTYFCPRYFTFLYL